MENGQKFFFFSIQAANNGYCRCSHKTLLNMINCFNVYIVIFGFSLFFILFFQLL